MLWDLTDWLHTPGMPNCQPVQGHAPVCSCSASASVEVHWQAPI